MKPQIRRALVAATTLAFASFGCTTEEEKPRIVASPVFVVARSDGCQLSPVGLSPMSVVMSILTFGRVWLWSTCCPLRSIRDSFCCGGGSGSRRPACSAKL